jgi:hypothetical protein
MADEMQGAWKQSIEALRQTIRAGDEARAALRSLLNEGSTTRGNRATAGNKPNMSGATQTRRRSTGTKARTGATRQRRQRSGTQAAGQGTQQASAGE